jgi:MFS family permease
MAMMVFFIMLALANGGIHSFSVAAWVAQGMTLELANGALTGYLFASAIGVLAGGYIADWTKRHGLVATFGFIAAASLMLLVGNGTFQGYALVMAMIACRLADRHDHAITRYAGARRGPARASGRRVWHCFHRLQYWRHGGAAAFRLVAGSGRTTADLHHHRRLHAADSGDGDWAGMAAGAPPPRGHDCGGMTGFSH